MSLPPGFLDELRTRLSIAQVVGRKVLWDARKSTPGKGDLWAPCPFHHEKTASFHVDDRKGYYYCFGCHAKGDAISFVRETETVSFMEAVEILAGEAGMPMPERDPRAQEKADRRTLLVDVMEMAVRHFRLMLRSGAGAAARDYLSGRRGLGTEAQDRWEIGFAPDSWQGLWDALKAKGVADDLILDAGLAKPSQKGGKPYDTFRGRIMFPIRDARGRCIAFGGRAMDPSDGAKYLNSPETALFDKGRSLFNHGPAREAVGKGQPLIVAEGYMDVIALCEAGFTGAVAPLGTAVTEHQLAMMWRMADEPIIALDGDTAGLRAALRVVDLALPLLEAGKSLRFALMPDGQDPDDLLKSAGRGAVQAVLDAARPLVLLAWERERDAAPYDTPEQKAGLEKRLRALVQKIADRDLQYHYRAAFEDYKRAAFRPAAGSWTPGGPRRAPKSVASTAAKSSMLARDPSARAIERFRESKALAICLAKPSIAKEFEDGLQTFEFLDAQNQSLCLAMLELCGGAQADELRAALDARGYGDGLNAILRSPDVRPLIATLPKMDEEPVRRMLAEQLAKLSAERGSRVEMEEMLESIESPYFDLHFTRVSQANSALKDLAARSSDDEASYDVAPTGAKMERRERSEFEKAIEEALRAKPGRGRRPN